MRLDTSNFESSNLSASKEPRFVIEVSFVSDNTDLYYFTSHIDAALPVSALSIDGIIERISGTSQTIAPDKAVASIGTMSFSVVDYNQSVTELQYLKLEEGKGLRGMRIRAYVGYAGLAWADYSLIQTQIVESVVYSKGSYVFTCSDIQREQRKTIFNTYKTNLSTTLNIGDDVIEVYNTLDFEMLSHGNSYSDAPSSTVGYVKIDKEIIRYTGKTATQFTGCTRGVLNTKEAVHTVDTSAQEDRRTEVHEYVYLEMPAVKLMHAILTGKILGQGSDTLPSNWNLGIADTYIRESDFTGIGSDLYDTTDDRNGFVVVFEGLKKTDGKRFIEKELLLLMGSFSPIYSDGAIGLKRMTSVLSKSGYELELNESNVVSHGDLLTDMKSMYNHLDIKWNWVDSKESFTRTNTVIDFGSAAKHGGLTPELSFSFRGLSGSRHSTEIIRERFNSFRDRYTGPPLRLSVTCLPNTNMLEVGDMVRVNLSSIQDYFDGASLNRTFEIQNQSMDWFTGKVTFNLFASSQPAGAISAGVSDNVIDDVWYSSEGINLATHTEAGYDYTIDYENIGGVGHIKASGSITGGANLRDGSAVLGTNSIYYHVGDLIVDAGVILDISDNIQLRVMGHLTIDGDINGVAFGLSGGADRSDLNISDPKVGYQNTDNLFVRNDGVAGFIGPTVSQGVQVGDTNSKAVLPAKKGKMIPYEGHRVDGQYNSAPTIALTYDGQVNGIPDDIRGTSGSSGGNTEFRLLQYTSPDVDNFAHVAGGAGGNGGAGLLIVSRGCSFGVSGGIDLSGGDSVKGSYHPGGKYTASSGGSTTSADIPSLFAGSGAPGAPGALYFCIDGFSSTTPDLGQVLSNYGDMPINTKTNWPLEGPVYTLPEYHPMYPYHLGLGGANVDLSGVGGAARIIFVIGAEVPAVDSIPIPGDVTGFDVFTSDGTTTLKWNSLEDINLYGYEIRYVPEGEIVAWNNGTVLITELSGTNITTVDIPDGSWTFMIKGLNTDFAYSNNPAIASITVTSDHEALSSIEEAPAWSGYALQNLLKYSGQVSDINWVKNKCTVDGNKVVFDGGAGTPHIQQAYDTGVSVANRTFSIAVWAWTDVGQPTSGILTIYTAAFSSGIAVVFTTTPKKFILTYTFDGATTTTDIGVKLQFANAPAVGEYCYVEAAQIVESPLPERYVETLGAPVLGLVSGTRGIIKTFDNKIMPNGQSVVAGQGWETFDSGAVDPYLKLQYPYSAPYYEVTLPVDLLLDGYVRIWSLIASTLHPAEVSGVADPILEIDHKTGAGSYGGYITWTISKVTARYVKFRMLLDTSVGVPVVSGMRNVIDALKRAEQGVDVIGIGGTAVTFTTPFFTAPFVLTYPQGSVPLTVTRDNITNTGFTARVFDTDGVEVGGTIDWTATGV